MSDFIYDDVEINVLVDPPVLNLQDKEVYLEDEGGITVHADSGYDALYSVEINPVLQTKQFNITENGTYSTIPDEGFCGIDGVTVNVNVASTSSLYDISFSGIHCDVTSPVVYDASYQTSELIDASSMSQITIAQQPDGVGYVHIYIAFLIEDGSNNVLNSSRCSFMYARTLSYSFAENITNFGFQPTHIVRYLLPATVLYPSLSVNDAMKKFLSCDFKFVVIKSSDSSVLGSFSVNRSCNLVWGWGQTSQFGVLF